MILRVYHLSISVVSSPLKTGGPNMPKRGHFRSFLGTPLFRGFSEGVCYTQNGQSEMVVCIFPLRKKLRRNVTHVSTALFPTTRARESIYKGDRIRQILDPWIWTPDPSDIGSMTLYIIISGFCQPPDFP